jgi:hypothetical protein
MNISYSNESSYGQSTGLSFAQSNTASTGSFTAHTGGSFKDAIGQFLTSGNGANAAKSEIEAFLNDMDLSARISLEGAKMDEKDLTFFLKMVEHNKLTAIPCVNTALGLNLDARLQNFTAQDIMKSSNVSNTILELLSKANSTNKPVRIDFDNNITLILRIDREGRIAAQFFPGDKAAEEYLKQNLASLRNRFDEQNLPYSEISYKQKRNQKGEKEKNEEQKQDNKGEQK